MEQSYLLTVKISEDRGCFLKVPRKHLNRFQLCIVRVTIRDKHHYFTTFGHEDKDADSVYFPTILARELGLIEGDFVRVKVVNESIPECIRCQFVLKEPKNIDLVSRHEELVKEILNQIRVIYLDMIFPFISKDRTILYFRVNSIQPYVEAALLVQNSVVELDEDSGPTTESLSSVTDKFKSFFSFLKPGEVSQASDHSKSIDSVDGPSSNSVLCFDIGYNSHHHVLNIIPSFQSSHTDRFLNSVWVNPKDFGQPEDADFSVAVLQKLLSPGEKLKKSELKRSSVSPSKSLECIDAKEEDLFLKTYVLVLFNPKCPSNFAVVSENLRTQLDLPWNSKIVLRQPNFRITKADDHTKLKVPIKTSFSLRPIEAMSSATIESIKSDIRSYLTDNGRLILCRGSAVELSGQKYFVITDSNEPWIFFNEKLLDAMDIRINKSSHPRVITSWGKRLPLIKPPSLKLDSLVDKGDQFELSSTVFVPWMKEEMRILGDFLMDALKESGENSRFSSTRKSILISGPKTSGKTSFVKNVVQNFEEKFAKPICTRIIECSSWKSMSALKKHWLMTFVECIYYQPSILVFEDLDLVTPRIARHEDVPGTDTIASLRIASFFSSLVKSFDDSFSKFGSQVAIIATCKTENALNHLLVPLRGRNAFSQQIKLGTPDYDQRRLILQSLLNHHIENQIEEDTDWLKNLARHLEGFLVCDLINLVDGAIHHAISEDREKDIGSKDFYQVLTNFRPSTMKGIKTERKSQLMLKDVGGLTCVKKVLTSTLLQPLKYPNLFAKCPLRPPRNILIYGAPGTGKSMLAEALSNESKVEMIKVRGPELLSKYIGRSEESIRLLFERARSVKPCVIFFDEFESLAPRRGQDTTGVTDRVVNQLLTQMDGVEVVDQGVYAIAATSRPDLLDPALLRPGRFDKLLRCDFPNREDRLEIWRILERNLKFHKEINENLVMDITEDFSGADIRALLINSQYEAIDDYESKAESGKLSSNEISEIVIDEPHIMLAREKTKPSIDARKRQEYDYIYDRFSGLVSASIPLQQKATLA